MLLPEYNKRIKQAKQTEILKIFNHFKLQYSNIKFYIEVFKSYAKSVYMRRSLDLRLPFLIRINILNKFLFFYIL